MRSLCFTFCFSLIFSLADAATAKLPFVSAEPLKLLSDAPPVVVEASKAVVAIETGVGSGTGFFISEDGLLLTNRHVTGPTDCALEGCFLTLRRNWIGSDAKNDAALYFVTPVFSVPELDIAVLQIWDAPPKERHLKPTTKLKVTEFIEPGPEPKIGDTVSVVGHSFGGIQRWNSGKLYQVRGDWRGAKLLLVSSMSGSPVIDAAGKLVGIGHRSLSGSDDATLDFQKVPHVTYYTAWSGFDTFWKHRNEVKFKNPLEGYVSLPIESIAEAVDFETFLEGGEDTESLMGIMKARRQSEIKFKEPEEEEAPVKGRLKKAKQQVSEFKVSELLLALCGAEIESEEASSEPDYGYHLCQSALDWFDCQNVRDAEQISIHGLTPEEEKKWTYKFCPSEEEQGVWKNHFSEVAELLELKNQDVISWLSDSAGVFESTKEKQIEAVQAAVTGFLKDRPDINVFEKALAASSWAANLDEKVENETTLRQILTDYKKMDSRTLFYDELLYTFDTLLKRKVLSDAEVASLIQPFLEDVEIPVMTRIDLESSLLGKGNYVGLITDRPRSRSVHRNRFQKVRKSIDAALHSRKGLIR